jgi:hypothetical protein
MDWVFELLEDKWGLHTFDRFAYDYNTKCKTFNLKFWCPGTSGGDAFAQNWPGENNWLVPPPRLVMQCLRNIRGDKCTCTLIIPVWQSAPFWPYLFPEGLCRDKYIFDYFMFRPGVLTKRGRGKNGIFDGRPLRFSLMAIRIVQ